MDWPLTRVVLWTGSRHSGKTSLATLLADKAASDGFSVAGILTPAVYRDDILAGYDAVDVTTGSRLPLLRRVAERERADIGPFAFSAEGLQFGGAALSPDSTGTADLIIVDEFGHFELGGRGWRSAVDRIVSEFHGVLLLVVSQEVADEVYELYSAFRPERIPITEAFATNRILQLLRLGKAGND